MVIKTIMICGNTHSFSLLEKVVARPDNFPFVLLIGPSGIGKSTAALAQIHTILGEYLNQDFLHIQDLSSVLGKKHTIKVESSDFIDISKQQRYQDRGAREIIDRLNLSPVGKRKIVLLENLERMTMSATNAFLKSLEEPLPQRQIIATLSNKELVLETILSRALVIYTNLVPISEIQAWLQEDYSSQEVDKAKDILHIAAGRPGRIKTLLDNEAAFSSLIELFEQLKLYCQKNSLTKLYKTLIQADKEGNLDILLEARMYREDQRQSYEKIATITRHRRMIDANVSKDSVLFSLAMSQ